MVIELLLTLAFMTTDEAPVELGAVQWQRDYAVALETSRKLDRPMLMLFQEVPG